MPWKSIEFAPRDGQWLDLGHVGRDHTVRGRWGVHRFSGEERWVDGDGIGLSATHFDYPRVAPKQMKIVAGIAVNTPLDRYYVEHDDNGDPVYYDAKTGIRREGGWQP